MKTTANLGLKKPEGTDIVNIDDLNGNMDTLDAEVVKKASSTADGRMAKEDKGKLDGIETGANKYVHPATHPASIIVQDANNRLVTDAEKTSWNAKETTTGAQTKANTAENNAKSYIDARPWQKTKLTSDNGICINVSNQNANNLTSNGFYVGENIANSPVSGAGQWWYIEVQTMAAGVWVKQIAINLFTNTFQMRTGSDSGGGAISWGPWTTDLFTSVSDGKNAIAGAIAGKGVPASGSDAFAVLASKIWQISTGLKRASGNGAPSVVEIANLDFEPLVIMIRCDGSFFYRDGAQGNNDKSARISGQMYFIKGDNSGSLSATVTTGRDGSTSIEVNPTISWYPNGFKISVRTWPSYTEVYASIANWYAIGI